MVFSLIKHFLYLYLVFFYLILISKLFINLIISSNILFLKQLLLSLIPKPVFVLFKTNY